MDRKRIENLSEWLAWKKRIAAGGFTLWQTQYGWDLPEGLIVGFMDADGQKLEIVTHSREVAEDIRGTGCEGDLCAG